MQLKASVVPTPRPLAGPRYTKVSKNACMTIQGHLYPDTRSRSRRTTAMMASERRGGFEMSWLHPWPFLRGTSGNPKNARLTNRSSSSRSHSTNLACWATAILVLVVVVVLLSGSRWISSNKSLYQKDASLTKRSHSYEKSSTTSTSTSIKTPKVNIQTGQIGDVPLYYCRTTITDATDHRNNDNRQQALQTIVLLHGAAFTKEDWKTSGILDLFCSVRASSSTSHRQRVVVALDLSVKVSSTQLQHALDQLVKQEYLPSLPVTALVTPSASGKAMVEWNDPPQSSSETSTKPLSSYITTWIPVASNSVSSVQPPSSLSTRFDTIHHILAMYGDQDVGGKHSMTLLQQYVPERTTLIELPGRHPCYLDAPQAFVETIFSQLDKLG